MPLWLDLGLHFLLSLFYAVWYLWQYNWKKKRLLCSFIIFAAGTLIDLDHRNHIKNIIKGLAKGRFTAGKPIASFHVCHSPQFALLWLILCSVAALAGYWDFGTLSFASYFTHMLIDSFHGAGTNNSLPAMIYKFFTQH